MKRVCDWMELREELRRKVGEQAVKDLDALLADNRKVAAIQLLRKNGITLEGPG